MEAEHRARPNPRSAHPTGPQAPYQPSESQGVSTEMRCSDQTAQFGMLPLSWTETGRYQYAAKACRSLNVRKSELGHLI